MLTGLEKGKNKSIEPYIALEILKDVINGKGKKSYKEISQRLYDKLHDVVENKWNHC